MTAYFPAATQQGPTSGTSKEDAGTTMCRASSDSALYYQVRPARVRRDRREVQAKPDSEAMLVEIPGLNEEETDEDDFPSVLPCYRHLCAWEDTPPLTPQRLPSSSFLGLASRSRRTCYDMERLLAGMGKGLQSYVAPPRVLCVARRHNRKNKYVDFVGEYHLDLIQENGGCAVIVPRTNGTLGSLAEYLPMDGLLVVEGNDMSDDVLQKYRCSIPPRLEGEEAARYASDTEFDISKDELEFALMRFALDSGCPILSLCRGSQMLNVLRGGTLLGDISRDIGTEICHLKDSSDPSYDSHRHPIQVTPKSPLAEWFADSLDDSLTLHVNSYHHQGVKQLGQDLAPMAYAPDGVLEAFYDPSYCPEAGRYVVGLQFHPERMMEDYPGCPRPYEAFLKACAAFKARQDAEAR